MLTEEWQRAGWGWMEMVERERGRGKMVERESQRKGEKWSREDVDGSDGLRIREGRNRDREGKEGDK